MHKYFFLFVITCLWSLKTTAQALSDTLRLREVVVYGIPQEKYALGSKIVRLDSLSLSNQQSRSLSDVLIRKSPLYFKEYGPGMLSTVSFRGTSASHTAVLWNGLNLNQPNLGQTDFSLIPLFAIEDIALQFGGSSALYGSDAIGGTIYLQSYPQWNNQLQLKLQQEIGSFGRDFSGLAASAGLGKWSITSKIYRQQADNDFEYINTLKKNRPIERNRNSEFLQKGLVQDVAYRFSNHSYLSFKSWVQQTHRQIQPTMSDLNSMDQQKDQNLNLSLQYKNNSSVGLFDMQLGHLYNYLLYNKGSEYRTRQYIGNARYEKEFARPLQLQAGGKINYIEADIEQYPQGFINESRADFFASLRVQPARPFKASLNLRQALVSGFTVPFTPSLGLEYNLYKAGTSNLQWLASGGRSYRVPTLNDRYWRYAGNPELKPEDSWNIESTLRFLNSGSSTSFEVNTTAYHMWVDNWILWLPGTVAGPEGTAISTWVPQNIQEVESNGVEVSMNLSQVLPLGKLEWGGNFGYTRSVNKKAKHEYDRTVGKQLPFVPLYKSNTFLTYQLKGWRVMANWMYTGTRYTSGEEAEEFSVPAFSLLDGSLAKSFQVQHHTVNLAFEVRNLLDRHYQNYEKRAMPGRNFNITAKYIFNQPFNSK